MQGGGIKNWEMCVLAGGLSSRMGRDKSKLRLGGRTLLTHARSLGPTLGLPVRIIRNDLTPRCGPLGGIITSLRTTNAEAVIFIPCDMPFLTKRIIEGLIGALRRRDMAVFAGHGRGFGFPCILRTGVLDKIEALFNEGHYSLQALARGLRARCWRAHGEDGALDNVNTPEEWAAVRRRWKVSGAVKKRLTKRRGVG